MQEFGNLYRLVIQWIPALCGIPGNEQADQLARCGAQEEQPSTSIHYQEKTTIIKTALKPRQEKDAYHLLLTGEREEEEDEFKHVPIQDRKQSKYLKQ